MLRNVSNLDLQLLRIFSAIVECGGFSAAQAELNMSQSTISTYIATLETRLGYRLCDRGRAGFRLTEKGERLLESIQTLYKALDSFCGDAQALAGRLVGELKVGLVDHLATLPGAHIADAIARFYTRDQEVNFRFFVTAPTELERGVIDGQLDMAIAYFGRRLPSLEYTELYAERIAIYCGRRHPVFARDDPAKEEIESFDWVRRGYILPDTLLPVRPTRFSATAHHMEAVMHCILAGTHLGYLPVHCAEPWVQRGEMRALAPEAFGYEVTHSLITPVGRPRSEALDAFIGDLLRTHGG